MPGVITRPALEIVTFFKVFAFACTVLKAVSVKSIAMNVDVIFTDLEDDISGPFSGPICTLYRGDVLIRMGAIRRLYKEFHGGNLSCVRLSWVKAKYSQINFRFNHYSPQPRDVIYGYLEVTASRAGTRSEVVKATYEIRE